MHHMCPPQAVSAAEITRPAYHFVYLILNTTADWELKVASTARQLAVDLGVSIESVVNTSLLLLVKDNLQDLASIFLGAQSLADNFDWVDDIGEDGIVDSSQSSGSWSLLCLRAS